MQPRTLILTILSVAALSVGCGKTDTTSQQLDEAERKGNQAAQEMKDYSYAQKTEFVGAMERHLGELGRDLDQLAAKVEKSSEDIKAAAQPKLQALRDQMAQLNKQLDEAKNAGESSWDSVKDGFKKAFETSKERFQEARQWMSDKIAP